LTTPSHAFAGGQIGEADAEHPRNEDEPENVEHGWIPCKDGLMAYGSLLNAALHKSSRTRDELLNKEDVKKYAAGIKIFLLYERRQPS
jgi:hypothetical protein